LPKGSRGGKSTGRKAPYKKADPLFPSKPRNYRIGNDIQPKRNLSRFVKWPRYVRLQRQRKILRTRLKVPPSINQFNRALGRDQLFNLRSLLNNYKPLTKKAKEAKLAEAAAAGGTPAVDRTIYLQFGLNHVTHLVEKKKAKLVVIAADVDPIELVVWLPALCRKMEIPYCIVRSKALLGTLVNQKNATCVALSAVNKEDQQKFAKIQSMCKGQFNDNVEALRQWGGGIMGLKTRTKLRLREEIKLAAKNAKASLA